MPKSGSLSIKLTLLFASVLKLAFRLQNFSRPFFGQYWATSYLFSNPFHVRFKSITSPFSVISDLCDASFCVIWSYSALKGAEPPTGKCRVTRRWSLFSCVQTLGVCTCIIGWAATSKGQGGLSPPCPPAPLKRGFWWAAPPPPGAGPHPRPRLLLPFQARKLVNCPSDPR